MIEADALSRSNSLKSVEDIQPTANDTQSSQQSKCLKKSFGKSTLSSFRRTASLRISSASRRLKSNFSIRSSKTNQKDALSPKWHNGLAKANSMRSHLVPSHSFTASGRPSIDASLSINSMDSHNLHSSTSSSSRANSFRSLEHTLMSSEDDIKPLQVSSRFKRLRRSLSTKIRRSGRNVLRRTTSFVVRRK
ncbi:unnamed protein product [Auanema sp. JU1783]|nr:unnamed protein product [Auanema sp. JU1783]